MTSTHRTSIKRKVTGLIMRASTTVLLVTVAAFMVYDLLTFRQTMERNLGTQAEIIAENCQAALMFKDENAGSNILVSLRAEPHILAAAIYDEEGNLFVKYPAQISSNTLPKGPENLNFQFKNSRLTLFQPILQSGTRLGTLYLQSDLTALYQRLQLYALISALIMSGTLLLVFWLSNTLQKRISDPIIALAQTATQISEQQNYSLRAPKLTDDELGLLTDSFNTMLMRIELSDSALRASEAQFRFVTDQAPVLLAHVDSNNRYKFVNQSYAERYGRKVEDIIGKTTLEVVGQVLFERARPYFEKALAGELVEYELEFAGPNQERRWTHAVYTPEKNSLGEVIGFVAVHTDITQRKNTELEIAHARDQALAASRAKDDFLAALSHELRTPLNPVLLVASDAAANSDLPPEVRKDFDMIRQNVELEARLIDDLLDLTRIVRGKLSLELRTMDLLDSLRDAIATVQTDADQKKIPLILELPTEPCFVLGDAVRLQQVFWNVLKNAVKFTPAGGKITVEAHPLKAENRVVVQITDTGIGLTSKEIDSIFTAFTQGEHAGISGSHQFGGLGLGLAISRMLVELHSGIIKAKSKGRAHGAIFIIELPSCDANMDLEGDTTSSVWPPVGPGKEKSGLRILLVEDHEPTRLALAHLLERRSYHVSSASSVTEAIALARGNAFDLVLSDIGLPDGDGYGLMSTLQQRFGLKGIALTGYGMDQDIIKAKQAGFVGHLTKPIRVEALERELALVLKSLP